MPNNPRAASLDAILAVTRARVAALKTRAAELERGASTGAAPRPFPTPGASVGVIAEVKRRSPSQGAIREDLDPVVHATAYERGGAVAVSVLRKDFVIDELQISEARAAGASAVLLIARVLTPAQLDGLARAVRRRGMTPLIEVHALRELDAALAAGPGVVVGVNARDLDTFVVDLRAAEETVRRIPPEVTVVAESGIETHEDVERLARAGADFVLVGTSVARQTDPEKAVRALVGVKRQRR